MKSVNSVWSKAKFAAQKVFTLASRDLLTSHTQGGSFPLWHLLSLFFSQPTASFKRIIDSSLRFQSSLVTPCRESQVPELLSQTFHPPSLPQVTWTRTTFPPPTYLPPCFHPKSSCNTILMSCHSIMSRHVHLPSAISSGKIVYKRNVMKMFVWLYSRNLQSRRANRRTGHRWSATFIAVFKSSFARWGDRGTATACKWQVEAPVLIKPSANLFSSIVRRCKWIVFSSSARPRWGAIEMKRIYLTVEM